MEVCGKDWWWVWVAGGHWACLIMRVYLLALALGIVVFFCRPCSPPRPSSGRLQLCCHDSRLVGVRVTC